LEEPLPPDDEPTIEVVLELDEHDAESLRLELRRLAKLHGVNLDELRIEAVDPPPA
jgi:hypothetical protein